MSNYRPISLLTSFSKIFEKVMQTRLQEHLTKYNILTKGTVWIQNKSKNREYYV